MTNPLSLQFWSDEERRLWADLEPLAQAAILAGVEGGLRALPVELEGLVNFDFVNRAAQRYLERYRLNTVANINATTRDRAVSLIREWMETDEGIDVLKRQMRPLFGKTRADLISTTEVTRLFGAGNSEVLWPSTGVVAAKVFRTAVDDRVCPLCGNLDGSIVALGDDFTLDVEAVANSPQMESLGLTGDAAMRRARQLVGHSGANHKFPPIHPGCRCWLAPQVSEGLLRREIGDILAQEFFAKVEAGRYDVYVARGQ